VFRRAIATDRMPTPAIVIRGVVETRVLQDDADNPLTLQHAVYL
jgi:hypothetical protein